MPSILKFRRGNTTISNAFTGKEGELFIDLTKKTVVIHDGVTQGGFPLPTSANITGSSADSFARNTANSATTLAQAAFNYANTIVSDTQIDPYARTTANGASALAQAAFNYANTILSLDNNIDQYARTTVNTNAINITTLEGINLTQNTNITNVDTKAQAAFDKANTGISVSVDQYARDTANTNAINITNNNTKTEAAFDKANSANILAQAAFAYANTILSLDNNIDQYARDTANTNATNITIIQGVDITQNTNISNLQNWLSSNVSLFSEINTTQNTNITTVDTKAQAAFDKANTGITSSIDQYARDTANTNTNSINNINTEAQAAFDKANSANILAQAAFAFANTIVSDTQIDPYARTTANTNATNITLLQDINVTQNTNITNVDTKAQAAFNKANTGTNQLYTAIGPHTIRLNSDGSLDANGEAFSISSPVSIGLYYAASNYSSNSDFLVDTSGATLILSSGANTKIWNFTHSGGLDFPDSTTQTTAFTGTAIDTYARNTVNTVSILAQAAFDKANTGVSTSVDQYARDTANTNTTNISIIQGVDTTQNTNITAADTKAQAAFDKANSANILAQAAFAAANTGGVGVQTYANSNVVSLLSSFGSNNITTTGNIASFKITTTGDSSGISSVIAGVTNNILPNTVASFSANVNNYTQLTLQNKNAGVDATADIVLTSDNGSDTVNFGDFGIINSGYDNSTPTNSLGNLVFGSDTYLYAQGNNSNSLQLGGNLVIGAATTGKYVKIFAGGNTASALVANISNTGMAITGNISVTGNIIGSSANTTITSGSYTSTFDTTGKVTLPGDLVVTGNVIISGRPAFRVTGANTVNNLSTTQNGTGILNYNNWAVDYQQGTSLNVVSGLFTAPANGLYQICVNGRNAGNTTSISQLICYKNGSTVLTMLEFGANSSMNHAGTSTVGKLITGDTLSIKVAAGTINFDGNDNWSVTYLG